MIRFLQLVCDGPVSHRYVVRDTVRLALTAYLAVARRSGDAMGWFLFTWIEHGSYVYQVTCTAATGEVWDPSVQSLSAFVEGKEGLVWTPNRLSQTEAMERSVRQFLAPATAAMLLRKYQDRSY